MTRLTAEFALSAFSLSGCPRWKRSEIAIAGRSNVGKSSLLNALTGVKASRGQQNSGAYAMLEFLHGRRPARAVRSPGFGYAKMPHHRCDLARFIMRHLRVAESREIAQREPVADREEIQHRVRPSFAGPREAFYSGQCVEEELLPR